MDVAGIEPASTALSKHLAYAQNAKWTVLTISRPFERWAALECGDARHLLVCPDLYSFSVYTACLASSSRIKFAFNPPSKLRPLMPQRRSAGIFVKRYGKLCKHVVINHIHFYEAFLIAATYVAMTGALQHLLPD